MHRIAWTFTLLLMCSRVAAAQSQSTPAPSPTPRAGSISLKLDAHSTFIAESTRGPGVLPPEGPGFAAGSPLSPLTPYDTFSSAPLTPGNALESAFYLTPTYEGSGYRFSVTVGAGLVAGSITTASYWGESLIAPLNPHLGERVLPYRIVFPTNAAGDDAAAGTVGILSATFASRDGSVLVRGGYFDVQQSDSFVFTQPALTNVLPQIAFATPESLGSGPPNLDWWQPSPEFLPLDGVDGVFHRGLGTVELTDAALPALPGTNAMLTMGSFVIDHGEGTRYSAQLLHLATGGALVSTTVLFGSNPILLPTPQGPLPESTIGGQRQTILGLRGAFHVTSTLNGVAEYGHSTYAADDVAEPGTEHAGNYYHLGLTQNVRRWNYGVDLYRNEPYYAQALLPYGAPENVWSVAWSWPGQWLKSNYQLIDNFPVNINREGYRAHYALSGGPLEVRASYGSFAQIDPITISNALQAGFVDGFFLPQQNAFPTLGRQQQYVLWSAWHTRAGDLTLDYDEDTMHRAAAPAQPQDYVSYDAPSFVLGFSRRLSAGMLGSMAYGRYGMRGSFGQPYTNIDFAQRVGMAGLEFQEGPSTAALVSVRWSGFSGIPSMAGGPSPAFSGTMLVFEQRLRM